MSTKRTPAGTSGGREHWSRAVQTPPPSPHRTTGGGETQAVYSAGRVVGQLRDGWLVKTGLDPARHKVRIPPGWATDADHLLIPGLKGVRLVLQDGTRLEAPIGLWQRHGLRINRGFGPQVLLCDEFWAARRPGAPAVEQLALL